MSNALGAPDTRDRRGAVWIAIVAIGVVVMAITPFASGQPDGWNRVALDTGLADSVRNHPLDGLPFASYEFGGIGGPFSGIVPGLLGCAVVFAIAMLGAKALEGSRTTSAD